MSLSPQAPHTTLTLLRCGILAPLVAAGVACLVGMVPIRLDRWSMQDLRRLQDAGVTPGSDIVLASKAPTQQNYQLLRFGVQQLAFPGGLAMWIVPSEALRAEEAQGAWAISPEGSVLMAAESDVGRGWVTNPEARDTILTAAERGALLFDSSDSKSFFQQRAPWLRGISATTLDTISEHRHDSDPIDPLQVLFRLWIYCGYFTAVWIAVMVKSDSPHGIPAIPTLASLPIAVAGLGAVRYLASWLGLGDAVWTLAVPWAVVIGLGIACRWNAPRFPLPRARGSRHLLALTAGGFVLLVLFAYPFDGDFFYNWLPQAKAFHYLDRHDPTFILGRGSMQAASYPPGFAAVFSTILWATGSDAAHPFLIEPRTAFAILLYRLLLVGLYLSLLGLAAFHVKLLDHWRSRTWLVCLASTLLLIPVTRGVHSGAESILFPLLGSSMVLVAMATASSAPRLRSLGLVLGGMATLLKWEAALLFVGIVIPWFVVTAERNATVGTSFRRTVRCMPWILGGLVATIAWRATLQVHNSFFLPVTLGNLERGFHTLPVLILRAGRILVERGHLVLLFLALPWAILYRRRMHGGWRNYLVPMTSLAAFAAWIFIFLFASSDAATYLQTSYERLIMIPTFSLILYACGTLARRPPPRAVDPEDPNP